MSKVKAYVKAALPTVAVAAIVFVALTKWMNRSEKVKQIIS